MLWLAATTHLAAAAPQAGPAPSGAVRTQQPSLDAQPDPRRRLSPAVQARLDAVLERFDIIGGGIAWKVRW
jgi:hypothetical protein